MAANLTQEELDERVAILKRFRALLEQQRTKFREYLKVLESQEAKICEENTESILAHSELEAEIVKGIGSLQKVIVPMQELYNSRYATYNPSDVIPVSAIQKELASLQTQVLAQNERNRNLLKTHMTQLKTQIQEFRNPYRSLASVYAQKTTGAGSRIQLDV